MAVLISDQKPERLQYVTVGERRLLKAIVHPRSMSDLITPPQCGKVRAICSRMGWFQDELCAEIFGQHEDGGPFIVEKLSKRAASAFIDYLEAEQVREMKKRAELRSRALPLAG